MQTPLSSKQIRVGVRELRAHLSGWLRQAHDGASILVMSRNVVVAEIRPPEPSLPRRSSGMLKGKIRMSENFDELPPGLLKAMEGEPE